MDKRKKKFGKRQKEKKEFEQKLLDLARVTRVVKGGRRFSFRALVVIGNLKGKVAYGIGKGPDVSEAINKAVSAAKKDWVTVKIDGNTIPFDVIKKVDSAKVLIKRAQEGRGIVAGGVMRAVLSLAGVKDVVAKSLGCSNKINVARATIEALRDLNVPLIGKRAEKSEKQVKEADKQVKEEVIESK